MYIHRQIEATLDKLLKQGKVVLVCGARQVGKTTMLKHHLTNEFNYVSLENPRAFAQAKQDAVLFFKDNELPLIIDEVQRAPELFSTVKWVIDESTKKGQIVLTGSQTYHLMQGVSESLAGRIRILEMSGLSLRELNKARQTSKAFIPHKIKETKNHCKSNIWNIIHTGSMPELQDEAIDWDNFYTSYVASYLERDVREIINLKNQYKFYNFMVACASRTGQLFNAADISNSIEVDKKTIKSWVSVLQASNIIRLLQPFWPNSCKSITKTPKLFFLDTGLVCHLTRWTTPDQLKNGALAGHIFETFVVSEVLKSFMNAGANLRDVWFYRDNKKREIDLVIQQGHTLHPVEIKTSATPNQKAIENFKCLDNFADYKTGFGNVICQSPKLFLVSENVQAISPWEI